MIISEKINELEQVFLQKFDERKELPYSWVINTIIEDYKLFAGHIQSLLTSQDSISQIEATFYKKEDFKVMKENLKKYMSFIHELLSLSFEQNERRVLQIVEEYKVDKKHFSTFFMNQSKKWKEHVFEEKKEENYSHFG